MLHTFLLAARAVGPSLVRNASRSVLSPNTCTTLVRNFSSSAGGGRNITSNVEVGRIYQHNAKTTHGGTPKPGDMVEIIGGTREGMKAIVQDLTPKQCWVVFRGK